MIKHRIFTKGEYIHALISNARNSNIVFPVRALIYDVKFDDVMPKYQIKIIKFYDDLNYLKRYLFDMKFDRNFENGITRFRFSRQKYKTKEQFQEYISASGDTYFVVVDSVMCTKSYNQILELYNDIQDFLIEKSIKDLYEMASRQSYSKGSYYYKSKGVFQAHLKKFLGDRVPDDSKYFDKLLYRPESKELDKTN